MKFIPLLILLFSFQAGFGQDKCGTMQFNEKGSIKERDNSKSQFEDWLKLKINQGEIQKQTNGSNRISETVYQIPVVVHVVHNGEALGIGGNIPDDQIISQISTLNEDFRRMNADKINTPASFESVAADVNIEFVLAKRDPEGLPTDGIQRVLGNQVIYTINQASELASNSYWPAEEYFNIWVADMSGGLLGFAKFPVSNEPGMDDDPNLNRLIDGVFLDYEYFGTGFNADPFSKGRTLVHEVGHWLGLRHIWGDGGCSSDDFCNDTPTQSGNSSGCPDVSQTSCSTVDMFQNYMDYTDDECMNLFTTCQSTRMRTVIENSPRRKDLLTSLGANEVIQVANDLGIKTVLTPSFGNCELTMIPIIEVRNYGNNNITDFTLEILADDILVLENSFTHVLEPLESKFIEFSEHTFSEDVGEISFKVKAVNSVLDGNSENDCEAISTFFPSHQVGPFSELFEDDESTFSLVWRRKNNYENPSAWSLGNAPNVIFENNGAILSYYGAPSGSFGELDYLISPVLDLTGFVTADLSFQYAYANHSEYYSDALTVVVSTDCGATFPEENILFQKVGASLSTTSATNDLFIPADVNDWIQVDLNFGEFISDEVVIAFIGSNGGGNNLYLDDVKVFSTAANDYDIGILKVESLPKVSCDEDITMDIYVKNFGKKTITDFDVQYAYGNRDNRVKVSGLSNLTPGKTEIVSLESFNILNGSYEITIDVSSPNGVLDEDLSNNEYVSYFDIDTISDRVPIKMPFGKDLESLDWHFIRFDSLPNWEIDSFEVNNVLDYSAVLKGYDITELGIENWLVSPILDFQELEEASMTFELSYGNRTGRNDKLKILASTNCGRSYDLELYNKRGSELAIEQSESVWLPESESDWKREFVNLNDLVGENDIRVAFVVTNQNGNNLYLDDIEFYTSDDENPVEISEGMRSFPNPVDDFVEVKFNFNIKEEILLRVVSLQGEVIAEKSFPNTLNQIYKIENIKSTNNGMYIVQAIGTYTNLYNKILIKQ